MRWRVIDTSRPAARRVLVEAGGVRPRRGRGLKGRGLKGRCLTFAEAGPYFVAEPPAAHLRLTYAAASPTDLTEGVRRLGAAL